MTARQGSNPRTSEAGRQHEEGLAAFLRPPRRERFIQSLDDKRLRRKLGARLHHRSDDFDDRYIRVLKRHTKGDGFVEHVHQTLAASGAPDTCHIFAPGDQMDGAEVDLRQALDEFMFYGDAMISCIPGKLGLYVGEDGGPVILLKMD
jgi:hypothetical protein